MENKDEQYKIMLEDASMKLQVENEKLRGLVGGLENDKAMLFGQLQQSRKHVSEADFQNGELRKALDRDKTGLAAGLAAIREEVKGRRWISDGRGSYTYDDDGYRKETGFALDAIEKIAVDALAASGKLAHEALTAKPKDEKPSGNYCKCMESFNRNGVCTRCGWAVR